MGKFYAVKFGRKKGVFATWEECKQQIIGFSGAIYKSFTTKHEAEEFIKENETVNFDYTVYTDGSYTNGYACGSAVVIEKKQIFCDNVKENPTNNRGELLGIMLALQHTNGSVLIRTDSMYSIQAIISDTEKNRDMIDKIKNLIKEKVSVKFEHVKAHSGIYFNEIADHYASKKVDCLTVFDL